MTKTFTIHEIVNEFNVTARTIRFYEEKGMIKPVRIKKSRVFSENDRARISFILKYRSIDMSIDDIIDMLNFYDSGNDADSVDDYISKKVKNKINELRAESKDKHVKANKAFVMLGDVSR